MSQISINCRGCSQQLTLPASAAGKRAKCPKCETVFEVAGADSPIVASTGSGNPYDSPSFHQTTQSQSGPSKAASYGDANPPPMGLMTIPLYISALIYFLIGLAVIALLAFVGFDTGQGGGAFLSTIWIFTAGLCFALAGFIVFFTGKLRKRKKWAWITAIAFGGLYTPSAFIFLGIPILIGALKPEVQSWFNTD